VRFSRTAAVNGRGAAVNGRGGGARGGGSAIDVGGGSGGGTSALTRAPCAPALPGNGAAIDGVAAAAASPERGERGEDAALLAEVTDGRPAPTTPIPAPNGSPSPLLPLLRRGQCVAGGSAAAPFSATSLPSSASASIPQPHSAAVTGATSTTTAMPGAQPAAAVAGRSARGRIGADMRVMSARSSLLSTRSGRSLASSAAYSGSRDKGRGPKEASRGRGRASAPACSSSSSEEEEQERERACVWAGAAKRWARGGGGGGKSPGRAMLAAEARSAFTPDARTLCVPAALAPRSRAPALLCGRGGGGGLSQRGGASPSSPFRGGSSHGGHARGETSPSESQGAGVSAWCVLLQQGGRQTEQG